MRVPAALLACVVSSALAQAPAPMQATHGALKSAELWFDAKATLGPFRGITRKATGQMTGGPALATVRGFVEAPSASLSTNNHLRDRDMRKTLEVEKYPVIRFDLDSVAVHAENPDSARVELLGRMTIHGVTKRVRIPAVVRWEDTQVRVKGEFEVILPQYDVTNLKRMLGTLVMQETIRVGLDVTFTIVH